MQAWELNPLACACATMVGDVHLQAVQLTMTYPQFCQSLTRDLAVWVVVAALHIPHPAVKRDIAVHMQLQQRCCLSMCCETPCPWVHAWAFVAQAELDVQLQGLTVLLCLFWGAGDDAGLGMELSGQVLLLPAVEVVRETFALLLVNQCLLSYLVHIKQLPILQLCDCSTLAFLFCCLGKRLKLLQERARTRWPSTAFNNDSMMCYYQTYLRSVNVAAPGLFAFA